MYIKVIISLIRSAILAVFVWQLTISIQFPLHQIRPLMYEIKQLRNVIRDIFRSKKAIKRMKEFPNAKTTDFKEDTDTTCIICHEDMVNVETTTHEAKEDGTVPEPTVNKTLTGEIKKLPCKHMFHTGCLRSWLLRQQTCPICRSSLLTASNTAENRNNARRRQDANRIQDLLRNIQRPAAANNNAQVGNNNNRLAGFNIRVNGRNVAGGALNQNNNAAADINQIIANTLNQALGNNNVQNSSNASSTNNTGLQNLLDDQKITPNMNKILKQSNKTIAIPKIPYNLSDLMKLSKEELAKMEGMEKLAVAKRIAHLRNIRTMCDSTISMMTQYEEAVMTIPEVGSSTTIKNDPTVLVSGGDIILENNKKVEKTKNEEKLKNIVEDFVEQEAKILSAKIENEIKTKERLEQKIADIKRKLAEKEAARVKQEAPVEEKKIESIPPVESKEPEPEIDMTKFEKKEPMEESSDSTYEEIEVETIEKVDDNNGDQNEPTMAELRRRRVQAHSVSGNDN